MIIQIVTALLDSFLLYLLFSNTMEFKWNPNYGFLSGLASFTVLISRYVFIHENIPEFLRFLLQVIGPISVLLIAIFFYQDSIKKKLLMGFLLTVILGASELFVMLLILLTVRLPFNEVISNDYAYIVTLLLCKLIAFFIIQHWSYRMKKIRQVSFSYIKELTIILSVNIAMFTISLRMFVTDPTFLKENLNLSIFIITLLVLFVSILSCYLISKVGKKSKAELEYKLKLQQIEMEHKVNEDMASMVYTLRSLRHDFNNHCNVMSGLLKTGQLEDLTLYLSQINDEIAPMNDFVFLENRTLTVLLNSKMNTALTQNIQLTYSICISTLPMEALDICTLFGNLLDNALEAAANASDEKMVHLSIRNKQDQILITCENTYSKAPLQKHGNFISTKVDTSIHGIGISNMKSVVEKYHGSIDITYDTLFCVQILLDADRIPTTEKKYSEEVTYDI